VTGRPRPATGDGAAGPDPADRRHLPFWIHQLVEYVAGAGIAWTGARASGAAQAVVVTAGLVLVLLAAVSDGPLGAGRLIGRRAHRAADGVIVVAAAAGGVTLAATDHVGAAVVVLVTGALVAYLFLRTRYERRPPRRRVRDLGGEVRRPGGAGPPRRSASAPAGSADAASAARALGRLAARARAARRSRP
jgi:hypothetical protein